MRSCLLKRIKKKIFIIFIFLVFMIPESMSMKMNDLVTYNRSAALTNALVYILENCGRNHNTVMIVDNDRSIIKPLSTMRTLTSIFLDDNFKIIRKPDQFRKKLDALIMDKESFYDFSDNFNKNAPWWNVETPCFILDTNNTKKNYNYTIDPVEDILRLYSHIPLLLYLLTYDKNNEFMIVSRNQLIGEKPSSWNLIDINQFSKRFDKNTICHEFYYDRSKHMNGYIKMTSREISNTGFSKKSTDYYLQHIEALRTQFDKPVYFQIFPLPAIEPFKAREYDWITAYGFINLFVWDFSTYNSLLYEVTFPFWFYQLNFLVHHRGYKTPWEKIQDYYGVWIFLSLFIILCTVFIVLKLNNRKRNLALTSFEILRFLINTAIVTPLNTSSLRIFMSVIFLYFLILHATFSGHLIKFLTKLEPRKNAETLEDLKDPRYTFIFHPNFLSEYLKDIGLSDKAMPYDDISKCMEEIALSKSVVCIADDSDLIYHSASTKYKIKGTLYKPQKGFGFYYTPGLAHRNKQTRLKIDKAFFRIFESGINNFERNKNKMKIINSQKRKAAQENHDFVPIDFKIFTPVFIVLGVGLVCAMISFFFEIIKYKNSSNH